MRSLPRSLRLLVALAAVLSLALPAAAQVPDVVGDGILEPGAQAGNVVIEPANPDATAVNNTTSSGLDVSGTVPTSAAIDRAFYVGFGVDGTEVVRVQVPSNVLRPPTPFGQYLHNDGGNIQGDLTLGCRFGEDNGGCPHPEVRSVVLEVHIGGAVYPSNDLPVDYVRPTITRFDVISPTQIRVTFTEAVRSPGGGDLPSDYVVTDPPREVVRVLGPTADDCRGIPTARPDISNTGCTRTAVLRTALPEDAKPTVDYEPDKTVDDQPIPGRTAHLDFADQRAFTVFDPLVAADLVRPAVPKLETVDGVAVPANGRLVGSSSAPPVTVSNVTEGHTVVARFELSDGRVLTGNAVDPRTQTLVAPALPSGYQGSAILSTIAFDVNGNRSDESSKNPPRADGSPATVEFIRDTVAPKPLLAIGDGPFVTVEFDEHALGANRPAEWKLTSGGPVVQVDGSGLSRLIKGSSQAAGRISYTPDTAAGNTLRDAAGNQVGAFTLDILSGRTVLANTPTQVDEGKALAFVIRLASAQDQPVTASYATQDGTGVAGLDYVAKSGSVTFQPGETQKLVAVNTIADDLDEDDETVVLRLTSVQNGEMTSKADRATGTILDGDPLPEVDVLDVTSHEGTTARVKVRLDTRSGRDVQVRYATANGTALAGQDFGARSGTLTITAGQREGEIVIPIEDDGVIEPTETFTVRISDPVNATIDRATAVVTILDGIGVEDGIDRVDGPSRTETSAEISKTFWDSSDVVVIATADAYPDALAGAPLASKHGAPILLTGRTGLHPAVRAEVSRLGATKAFVLGGAAALSSEVDDDLRAAGVRTVTRVSGKNRFETAQRIAERVGGRSVYLVEGANADPARGWPDAVAVSALAAAQQRPILLTERDRFPGETRLAMQRLNPSRVDIVGGTQAVNGSVAAAADAVSGTVARIAGRTRYETSAAIAEASRKAGLDPENTWVATGDDWPDSLSASPAVARTGGILILVDSTDLNESPPARAWAEKHTPRSITVVGGIKAISQKVFDQLRIVSGL